MDSYFGQIGHSFYGGPNGQSFSVKETFPNKVALDADLATGFTSPIQVGEYVIISYGNPHEAPVPPATKNTYEQNRDIDYAAYSGQTYNATLWQKSFSNETLVYDLIVGFETSSPEFVFVTNVQDPGEFDPTINNIEDISTSEITKTFQLSMPNAWNIAKGEITISDPGDNDNIDVVINRYRYNDDQEESDITKYIHFTLPKPWDIAITRGDNLNADDDPVLTPTDLDNVEVRRWELDLPATWDIQLGELIPIDPVNEPQVEITNIDPERQIDHNVKYIYFSLPNTWDIALGNDSGYVNPIENASVLIDRYPDQEEEEEESDTTKYVHIKIPNAWDIVKADDSEVVNPGIAPNVVIDRQAISGVSGESDTTKYVHFKLPKAWNFALGKVELVLPNANPEVVLNNENATGVTSLDTKYLHFKLPVAQEFTTDAFSIELLGPLEAPSVKTQFNGGDTIHRYPKVELSLPRAEKTIYGNAIAAYSTDIGNDIIVSSSGSSRSDYMVLSELEIGDFYINTTYAKVYKIKDKSSSAITATYLGSMQLAIPNIQGNPINPYDANGNPRTPTVVTNAVGPVSSWNVNVDVIKAPVFKKSEDSGFVASTAQGVISSKAANDGVTYTIKVPKGTKITTQSEVPDRSTLVNTAMDGDLYLDNNGWIYRFDGITGNSWVRGVTIHGNDFVIKNKGESETINITASDLTPYSLESTLIQKMGAYILDTYPSYNNLKENEILNIVYSPELGVSIAYWLYKGANEWGGDQVTGTVSSAIIENTWQTDNEDNKAYSVTLINLLRTTITQLTNRVTALEDAMRKAWGELPIE